MSTHDLATLDRLLTEEGYSGLASAIADLCEARAKDADPGEGWVWENAAKAYREVAS